jgi:hypothetical protein
MSYPVVGRSIVKPVVGLLTSATAMQHVLSERFSKKVRLSNLNRLP